MRIRRRPQPSSFPSSLQPSDPSTSTAPQTPQNTARNQECLDGGKEEGRLHASVDLGQKSSVARRLALPQDNAVGCVKSLGAEQGADDTHRSLANGHRGTDRKDDVTCTGGIGERAAKVEGPVRNGVAAPVAPAVILAVKEERNGSDGSGGAGGAKKRRGPAVLMEGSRCSRVNGRGWRCSQPTLVGYSLCEHHLGKGRMRSTTGPAVAGSGRGGAGQLGRTEHRARIPAAVGAVTTAALHAEEPGMRRC